jgi:hypothetical protein
MVVATETLPQGIEWLKRRCRDWIVMPITIFHTETGSTEKWLEVNDDGTVSYYERLFDLRTLLGEIEPRQRNMTVEEAKSDWAFYANDIDEATSTMALRPGRLSH